MTQRRKLSKRTGGVSLIKFLMLISLHLVVGLMSLHLVVGAGQIEQGSFRKSNVITRGNLTEVAQGVRGFGCAQRCMRDPECKGHMYNKVTWECRLVTLGNSVVDVTTGWKLFLQTRVIPMQLQQIKVCEAIAPGFNKTPVGCYYIHDRAMNWTAARAFCEGLGQDIHLATVDTQEKIDVISGLAQPGLDRVWTGGNEEDGDGILEFVGDEAELTDYSLFMYPHLHKPYVVVDIGVNKLMTVYSSDNMEFVCEWFAFEL